MPTRYWIALTTALVLLSGGAAFCWQTRRAVHTAMREAGAGPVAAPGQSLDSGAVMADFGMEVPPSLLWRIQLADTLRTFWPVWSFFVFGICFGVAWAAGGRGHAQSMDA